MRIVYVQYADPALYPPLEHSSRIFAGRGWQVLFLGIGAWGKPDMHFPKHTNIIVRLLPYCSPGLKQKLHYLFFAFWVFARILAFRPQWVYVSDPLACPAVRLLSGIPGLRLIYHEHDQPSKTDGASKLVIRSRLKLARTAWCNILPNAARLANFRAETGTQQRAHCVWNCPRRDEVYPLRTGDSSPDIWLIYHGSIVPDRLPLTVLEAMALLPANIKLRMIGYETIGSQGYREVIREKARQLGLTERIELIGAMPSRRMLLDQGRKSDIGLSFMPMVTNDLNMQAMTGASNKAFDYLACGLVLLVSDLPDWCSFFVEPGYGIACDPRDSASIARAVEKWIANPARIREMGERGRSRVEKEWNYEVQFGPVLEAMEEVMKS